MGPVLVGIGAQGAHKLPAVGKRGVPGHSQGRVGVARRHVFVDCNARRAKDFDTPYC
jgi:hypothetical protein